MQVIPVDEYNNLFAVSDVFPQSLVDKILFTPWMHLRWKRQLGQELWPRRRILESELPWADEWNTQIVEVVAKIQQVIGIELDWPKGTAWWLDEPGFAVGVHTDGSLPGAMQITWIADNPNLGTCFYHDKNGTQLRRHFLAGANQGYLMINPVEKAGYSHLQWHGMENPVPQGTFRLSSYSLIYPK